jgi:hypothetical protein
LIGSCENASKNQQSSRKAQSEKETNIHTKV